MKNNIIYVFTAIMCLLSSCQKMQEFENTNKTTFSAAIAQPNFEGDTKTLLNNDLTVSWETGDDIYVYSGDRMEIYTSSNISGSEALFTGEEVTGSDIYAIYPSSIVKSISNSIIEVRFPMVQKYRSGTSFDSKVMPMWAKQTGIRDLNFSSLFSILKLSLTGTEKVQRIIVISDGTKLSGNAIINPDGSIEFENNPSSHKWVELDCGEGVQLSSEPQTFLIAVPSGSYDFSVRVVSDKCEVEASLKSTTSPKTFTSNKIKSMPGHNVSFVSGEYMYVEGDYCAPGVQIKNYTWAQENCGFSIEEQGLYYEAGRKHGQNYTVNPTDPLFTSYRMQSERVFGPISPSEEKEFVFIKNKLNGVANSGALFTDVTYSLPNRWNNGTEANPVRTENDPCPKGWRVPTRTEIEDLLSLNSLSTFSKPEGFYCYRRYFTDPDDSGKKIGLVTNYAGGSYPIWQIDRATGDILTSSPGARYLTSSPAYHASIGRDIPYTAHLNESKSLNWGASYESNACLVRCVKDLRRGEQPIFSYGNIGEAGSLISEVFLEDW